MRIKHWIGSWTDLRWASLCAVSLGTWLARKMLGLPVFCHFPPDPTADKRFKVRRQNYVETEIRRHKERKKGHVCAERERGRRDMKGKQRKL